MHVNVLIRALGVRRQAADIGAPLDWGCFSPDRSLGGAYNRL